MNANPFGWLPDGAQTLIAETDRLLSVLMHLRGQLVARAGEGH